MPSTIAVHSANDRICHWINLIACGYLLPLEQLDGRVRGPCLPARFLLRMCQVANSIHLAAGSR